MKGRNLERRVLGRMALVEVRALEVVEEDVENSIAGCTLGHTGMGIPLDMCLALAVVKEGVVGNNTEGCTEGHTGMDIP